MSPPTAPRVVRCRIAWSAVGVVVGISIFATFGFYYRNWHCAAWGLASGVFAALTLAVHFEYYKYEWNRQPKLLVIGMVVGCLGLLVSIAAFIVYLVLATTRHQGLTAWNDGYYLACVWSAMTCKWTFFLFYFSFDYRKILFSLDGIIETPGTGSYQRI